MLIFYVLAFAFLVLFALACFSWFESREIWNGGICAATGKPWQVIEINGDLYLDDCKHRVRLNGIMIHPAITDALREQRKVARA